MEITTTLKNSVLLICMLVAVTVIVAPSMAVTDVENGGIVMAGDEHYSFRFLDSTTCKVFGWALTHPPIPVAPSKIIDLTNHDDVVFPIDEYKNYNGLWECLDPSTGVRSGETFVLKIPEMAFVPTTPVQISSGSITPPPKTALTIDSTPKGGDVFIDGLFIGITPLTYGVFYGDHIVVVRKLGYSDSRTTINTTDKPSSDISLNLEPNEYLAKTPVTTTTTPITTSTTVSTSVTTTEPTAAPTAAEETTQIEETVSVEPVVHETPIDYKETIAAMQSQIDAHGQQIADQQEQINIIQQIINAILSFLGWDG